MNVNFFIQQMFEKNLKFAGNQVILFFSEKGFSPIQTVHFIEDSLIHLINYTLFPFVNFVCLSIQILFS